MGKPSLSRFSLILTLALFFVCGITLGQNNPHGDIDYGCELCHSPEGWGALLAKPGFDHQSTSFPLLGRHLTVGCRECHESLKFREAGSKCADCHRDVHANQFGLDCEDCHAHNQQEMNEAHQEVPGYV